MEGWSLSRPAQRSVRDSADPTSSSPPRQEPVADPAYHPLLYRRLEVDQDIAQEDHIEAAKLGGQDLHQVERKKAHALAQGPVDEHLPAVFVHAAQAVPVEQVRRQPAEAGERVQPTTRPL